MCLCGVVCVGGGVHANLTLRMVGILGGWHAAPGVADYIQ